METSNRKAFNNSGNVDLNVNTDTIADVDISNLEYLSPNAVHHELHHNPSLHKNLFPDSVRNEMLMHYNRIVISSFKEFFQSINMNNVAEVLQGLKELNFVLANRAPELTLHYNTELEPQQITAEEVPKLVRAHLTHNTAYNPEHSIRGRPHSRGNQCHWYSQQISLLLRDNQHSERSETHFHSNTNYGHLLGHYLCLYTS